MKKCTIFVKSELNLAFFFLFGVAAKGHWISRVEHRVEMDPGNCPTSAVQTLSLFSEVGWQEWELGAGQAVEAPIESRFRSLCGARHIILFTPGI